MQRESHRLQTMKSAIVASALALMFASISALGSEAVTLHYVDRPPYATTQKNATPTGVVADPASEVFKKSHIPLVWSMTPVNRQFVIIKENKGRDCLLGMEQTPSRSQFAKFTEPVYISQPLVAIIHPKIKVTKGMTIQEMLEKYSILVKENYTMGDELTALVMKSQKKQVTTIESSQMVQMVALGRADFMMISNDEVEAYIQQGILDPKGIRVTELAGAQKSFTRRLMCSLSVEDSVIEKLNHEIRKLDVKPTPIKMLPTLH